MNTSEASAVLAKAKTAISMTEAGDATRAADAWTDLVTYVSFLHEVDEEQDGTLEPMTESTDRPLEVLVKLGEDSPMTESEYSALVKAGERPDESRNS